MTKNSTKKALLMSCISLLLCLSMLIGTTFAWFTDSATTGVNTIVAGNLDIALYEGVVSDGAITYPAEVSESTKLFKEGALYEPGYTEVVYLKLTNLGTLALNYQLAINVANEVPGTNVKGETFKLSEVLEFGVINSTSPIAPYADREAAQAAVAGKTGDLATYNDQADLLPGESVYLALVLYMPTTVGNEANYKTGTTPPSVDLGVNVMATQTPHENDSYNDQYDKDAVNAPVSVSSEEELLEAISDGKNVKLAADIELTETITIAAGSNVTIDLNGNALTAASEGATAIENRGTLTIEDAEGTGSITARIGVSNYGTLILNNGTVVANEQGGAAIYNNAGSNANFTMNGGTLEATFVGSYADSTGGACIRNTGDSVTTITGGTLKSRSARTYAIISNGTLNITPADGSEVTMTAYRGIAVDAGTATINGGTFTVLDANEEEGTYVAYETYYALYVGGNDSVVVVNGGTFTAPDSSVWRPDWDEAATDLVINGGTFNGSLIGNANYYPSKHIAVKGGVFDEDPNSYLADGYAVVDNGDGTYTVSAAN